MAHHGLVADFVFCSRWEVAVPPERTAELLTDLAGYPGWWPQTLAVARLGPQTARVLCRSRLPYTLDLVLDLVSQDLPLLEVAIAGDLNGRAQWRLDATDAGEGTLMTFTQEVQVGGLLGHIAPLVRPILVWNHEQMMNGARHGMGAALSTPVSVRDSA